MCVGNSIYVSTCLSFYPIYPIYFLSIYFSIYLYMCNKTYIHILCIYTLQYYNSDMWYLRLHVMGMILGVIEHRLYTEEMVMNHGETNCQISNLVHCSTLLPGRHTCKLLRYSQHSSLTKLQLFNESLRFHLISKDASKYRLPLVHGLPTKSIIPFISIIPFCPANSHLSHRLD